MIIGLDRVGVGELGLDIGNNDYRIKQGRFWRIKSRKRN